MGLFNLIFGQADKVKEVIRGGAVIIDVRTKAEFSRGHVEGSRNIPLNIIEHKVSEIKKFSKPVVLCCASGARSGAAASILKKKGIDCINGGSWNHVKKCCEAPD